MVDHKPENHVFRKRHLWLPIIVIFILMLGWPTPPGLSATGWRVIAIFSFVVMIWVTEVVPIPVGAIIGVVLLALLGATSLPGALSGFASGSVFLILAGFVIAAGMVKTGLDRRIAYTFVGISKRPDMILLGLIFATGLLSFMISNTATVLIMIPIALTIGEKTGLDRKMLLISVAFAASIGGVGLVIGTPPNVMAAEAVGWGFYQWVSIGAPFALIMLFALWACFRFQFKPHALRKPQKLEALHKMSLAEKKCAGVILFTLGLWVTEPFHGINSVVIGLMGGILMFILLFDWKFFEKQTDWGAIIMIGGAISLANALTATGAAAWIAGGLLNLTGVGNPLLLVFGFTALSLLTTQFVENIAVSGMYIPILLGVSQSTGLSPASAVIIPTMAVSMAFLIPPGTAPNMIIHGRGVSTKEMFKAGILPTMIALLLLFVWCVLFVGRI